MLSEINFRTWYTKSGQCNVSNVKMAKYDEMAACIKFNNTTQSVQKVVTRLHAKFSIENLKCSLKLDVLKKQ